jgi:restriction endonuclease S subunit
MKIDIEKWEKVKLEDLCLIERGGSPRPIENFLTKDHNGINWIKIGDAKVNSKHIDSTNERIITEGSKYSRKVRKGDFILSNSMSFGRPYILNIDGCIHDGWLVLSDFSNKINKDFLYYILSSSIVKKQFENEARGAIVKNLNIDIVKKVIISLPELEEQKRIVKIIETKLSAIEKIKTANDIQLSIIKKLFDSCVDNIYRNGNWNKVKLGDITIINPSTRGKTPDDNEMCVSFVPMTAVDTITGTISNIENKKLSDVRKGYTYFENEDILFAKITPCMENGKSAIARNLQNKIGFGSTEFHVIKTTESILPEWVHFYLRQKKYLKEAKNYMTGSVGQQRLPDDYLYDTLIPLPPLEEQKKIVSMLIQKQSLLNNFCNNVVEQSTYIKALPSSILRKAFNGDY